VREILQSQSGISSVLDRDEQQSLGVNHPRAGDLVALAAEQSWFTYYYWLDDAVAPDFARTVDIHRKVGYDPAELFIDPRIRLPAVGIAKFLLAKKLGLRGLLNVVPLDATLVKGSHGRVPESPEHHPLLIIDRQKSTAADEIPAREVYRILRDLCGR
jgi:hypothetical protein